MQVTMKQLKKSPSLASELVESIRTQIVEGTLKPGAKLPPEKEIGKLAGVSRSVVREALSALKAESILNSRQGVGNFVTERFSQNGFTIKKDEFNSLKKAIQILEHSKAVQNEMAVTAAENRSKEQMEYIWRCLPSFQVSNELGDCGAKEEHLFYIAIAQASGNQYTYRFIKYIEEALMPLNRKITNTIDSFYASIKLEKSNQEYINIAQAIDDKNPELAKLAIRQHLKNKCARFS